MRLFIDIGTIHGEFDCVHRRSHLLDNSIMAIKSESSEDRIKKIELSSIKEPDSENEKDSESLS